ncbi:MAG: hypothetical protein ACKVVT_07935 [Dehalococcoidia bacterium]
MSDKRSGKKPKRPAALAPVVKDQADGVVVSDLPAQPAMKRKSK